MRGSGKSLFSEVGKELGIPTFEMSQNVVDLMLKTDILITNYSLREFSDALRAERGKDAVARMMVSKLKSDVAANKSELAIIIGIRSPEEVEYFLSQGFKVKTAAILADEKIRFARVQIRRRPEDAKTIVDFRWADGTELGWGLGAVLDSSEFKLNNEGTPSEAKKKIADFLRELQAR